MLKTFSRIHQSMTAQSLASRETVKESKEHPYLYSKVKSFW